MNDPISSENKLIAKAALEVFGGKPAVFRYWDDNRVSWIDILSCVDRPELGTTSISTIGLSQYPIGLSVDEMPLRVELVGACASGVSVFPNIMATCAFNIINTKYACYPGAIFSDVIDMYIPAWTMKHILFVSPFLWGAEPKTLVLSDKRVAWLLAVPISNQELAYAQEHSSEMLEDLFAAKQIDIFDLNRPSVI